jgi:hypothetical protein
MTNRACLGDLNPGLFLKFPYQSLFGAFARFNLTARKLPLVRHVRGRRALGKENLFTGIANDANCNLQVLHEDYPVVMGE